MTRHAACGSEDHRIDPARSTRCRATLYDPERVQVRRKTLGPKEHLSTATVPQEQTLRTVGELEHLLQVTVRMGHEDEWVLNLYRAMQDAIGQQLRTEYELPTELTPKLVVLLSIIDQQSETKEDRVQSISGVITP
jgi:hypothetical protein